MEREADQCFSFVCAAEFRLCLKAFYHFESYINMVTMNKELIILWKYLLRALS